MFNGLKNWVGKLGSEYIRKYDVNWWARFLKLANSEDIGEDSRVHDTMRQSAWVNIAVTTISKNIARAEPEVYTGDTLLESGPIWELFQHPNSTMSRYELWEATAAFYCFRGEFVWIFNDDFKSGIPREIFVLDPRHFKHHLDEAKRKITMWTYEPSSQNAIPFLPDELIHSHEWNPWDLWRGVNPMTGLSMEVEQDYLASKSNLNLLRNGSVPGGLLTAEGPISEDEAKAVKERWKREHAGADRAHEIAVLGYGVKYQQIQQSMTDMQYFDLKKWDRQAVLAKYGVPPAVVGVQDDMSPLSGSDTSEQRKMFWSTKLIPMLRQFEDDINRKLLSKIAAKTELRFNTDKIPELQQDEDKRFARYGTAIDKGMMTIAEAREALGLEKSVAWGDTWWKPMGLEDVSAPEPEPVVPPAAVEPVQVSQEAFSALTSKPITKTHYSDIYKTAHWWKMANTMDTVERGYNKALKTWLYTQRSRVLRVVAENMKGQIPINKYDPNQPRDPDGRWSGGDGGDGGDGGGGDGGGGGGGGSSAATSEEVSAIESYIGTGFERINGGLRSGDLDGTDEEISALDSAINKQNAEKIIAYRGTDAGFTDQLLENTGIDRSDVGDLVGCEFKDKGFVSVSESERTVENFVDYEGGTLVTIKGECRSLATDEYAGRQEHERILSRDSKFRITKAEMDRNLLMIEVEVIE